MISHELKCIFIHIQRTGGTSIERWLQGEDQWNICHNVKHITTKFAKYRQYPEYYDDYFKFTFVRNPYERVLSELFINKMFHGRHLDLDLNNPDRLLRIDHGNYMEMNCGGGSHINGFKEYGLPDEVVVEERNNWKPNCIYQNILSAGVDKVYKYEEYEESLEDISSILGVSLDNFKDIPRCGQRPVENRDNVDFPYKTIEDLKAGDIQQINDIYGSDFEVYGYERL